MISKNDIAVVVLVGGKSSRMNYQDKYKLPYGNTTMLQHIIEQFCDFTNIYISTNTSQDIDLSYPCIMDKYENIGPLGGIQGALSLGLFKYYFVISCDMPGITKEIILKMYEMLIKYQKCCIIARNNDRIQPLFAIYNSDILQIVENQINMEQFALKKLLEKVDVAYVDFSNSYSNCFNNINTVQQYKEIQNNKVVLFGEKSDKEF